MTLVASSFCFDALIARFSARLGRHLAVSTPLQAGGQFLSLQWVSWLEQTDLEGDEVS
jgi:hypothetical protein